MVPGHRWMQTRTSEAVSRLFLKWDRELEAAPCRFQGKELEEPRFWKTNPFPSPLPATPATHRLVPVPAGSLTVNLGHLTLGSPGASHGA